MTDFFRNLVLAARQWPIYTAVVLALLSAFVGTGLGGVRWLGDDNETNTNELVGGPRSGGHGGYGTGARFYHK